MNKIKYEEKYTVLNKEKKTFFIFLIISITAVILDLLLFFNLISYENFNAAFLINLPIIIVLSLILSFFVLYIRYIKKEVKFLGRLFSQYYSIVEGKISSISENIISIRGRNSYEIVVEEKEGNKIVYLEAEFNVIPFKEGDMISLKISETFILEYEVINHETL